MAKLDVGVGDEFPTEEITRDADGTVHHHHYYYRRPRRPFGPLRLILSLALIWMVFHLVRLANRDLGWNFPFLPHGYVAFAATLLGIVAVIGAIAFLGRAGWDDRR